MLRNFPAARNFRAGAAGLASLPLVLALMFALASALLAQPQNSSLLAMDFRRLTWERGKHDTLSGMLWYQPPGRIIMMVEKPIQQTMLVDGKQVLLYYPKEKKAFKLISKQPFPVPFFQAFLGASEGKTNLPEMGFSLARSEEKGDTLYSIWEPPKKSRKALGQARVGMVKGHAVLTELKDVKGHPLVRSLLRGYADYQGRSFPSEVEIQSWQDGQVTVEKTFLSNLRAPAALPDELKDFQVPAGTDVKELEL